MNVFEEIATRTADWVCSSWTLDVRMGEETLTDVLVLDLKRARFPGVKVFQTTKAAEAHQGTDLEFLVRTNDGAAIALAVQAKKLGKKLEYGQLGKFVKLGARKVRQIDILEDWAARSRAVPVYLLFNGDSDPGEAKPAWHCCQDPKGDYRQLGCTFVPSWRVRTAIETRGCRKFGFLHSNPAALPWRCPFVCKDGNGRWTRWLEVVRKDLESFLPDDTKAPRPPPDDWRERYRKVEFETARNWPTWLWERPSGVMSRADETLLFENVPDRERGSPKAVILLGGQVD